MRVFGLTDAIKKTMLVNKLIQPKRYEKVDINLQNDQVSAKVETLKADDTTRQIRKPNIQNNFD